MLKYILLSSSLLLLVYARNPFKGTLLSNPSGYSSVMELSRYNFQYEVSRNNFLLVEFYAPWCPHCRDFEFEYEKLSRYLNSFRLPIQLARVDGSKERQLLQANNISKYPTLKLFRYSTPIEYVGTRRALDIFKWLKTKIMSPALMLKSVHDVERFIDEHEIGVIGFYDYENSIAARGFLTIANMIKQFPFAICDDAETRKEYEAKNGDMIITKRDDDNITFINK